MDDIYTTGGTVSTISSITKEEFPNSEVLVSTLTKTSNPRYGSPTGNQDLLSGYKGKK